MTKERILYVILIHGWSRREIGPLCRITPCMDAELVRILYGFIIMEYREKKVLILQEIELLCHNLMNIFFFETCDIWLLLVFICWLLSHK